MKKYFPVSVIAGAFLFVPFAAYAAGTNGSFENGTDPGVFTTVNAGGAAISGWSVDSGSVDYIGTYWAASDGSRSIDLSGNEAGSMSQTFATVPGVTYQVTFDLSGNPDGGPSVKDVKVSATGAVPQDFTYDTGAQGTTRADMKWARESYSFVAAGSSTALTFASQVAGFYGPALDNVVVSAIAPACSGDDTTFDTFALGTVNSQHGWSSTGSYDQAVVDNVYGYPTFGCKSLRISDAVTSGSFGDQTFSYFVANEAGEADALNGGYSAGTRQNHFEARFDLASVMPVIQPGMHVSVSPDRGDGARMSYLRFEDQADGIHVFFDDVEGTTNPANFVETDIATLSRSAHTIQFVMDFVNGPSNDVVKIFIDGSLVHTGTSWENYYRFDSESNPTLVSNSRTVDSLLFRESGAANPADAGKGFLIDNVRLSSSTVVPPPAVASAKSQCMNDGWKAVVDTAGRHFKNQGDCVSFVATKGKNTAAN